MTHLLHLDLERRRDWIDSLDSHMVVELVLEKYPCFKEADEVMVQNFVLNISLLSYML